MITEIILIFILCLAAYTDLREQRIPNWLTFPAIFAGIGLNACLGGWMGVVFGVKGLALGIAFFLIPFLAGGLGGGDVKLLGAVGALMGPEFVVRAFIITALVGGCMAVWVMWRQKVFRLVCHRLFSQLLFVLTFGMKGLEPLVEGEAAAVGSFPYGVAIAIGTTLAWAMSWVMG